MPIFLEKFGRVAIQATKCQVSLYCEILFGLPLTGDPILEALNYVIILAKNFINKKRNLNKELIFVEFIYTLKENLKVICKTEQNVTENTSKNNAKLYFDELLKNK